jgi:hypothetical protein
MGSIPSPPKWLRWENLMVEGRRLDEACPASFKYSED